MSGGERECDSKGNVLCTAALWDMKPCGRGDDCDFSHSVPEAARVKSDEIEMLRKERIIEYNHEEHGLATLIAALLECVDTEQLHDVHKRSALPTEPPLCPTLMHAFKLGGRKIPKKWATVMGPHRNKKVITRMHNSAEYNAWLDGPPTLRVAMPSRAATIGVHRDADYPGHHAAEINFWCPLVSVSSTNTLWVESEPKKAARLAMDGRSPWAALSYITISSASAIAIAMA
eukprot:gene741-7470_t